MLAIVEGGLRNFFGIMHFTKEEAEVRKKRSHDPSTLYLNFDIIRNELRSFKEDAEVQNFVLYPIFSRRFRRKCTTLTVASFFSSVQRDRSTFLFICSTSST